MGGGGTVLGSGAHPEIRGRERPGSTPSPWPAAVHEAAMRDGARVAHDTTLPFWPPNGSEVVSARHAVAHAAADSLVNVSSVRLRSRGIGVK